MTEDFLARWSRRKREAVEPAKAETRDGEKQPPAQAPESNEPEFDLATLPPIDSINALTDVTAFLRAGVPVELTRAALRRVWTADPAIRDFIGLAENAWDFTDPNAMPGFGPLESTEEVRRMVAQIVDKIGEAVRRGSGEEAAPEQTSNDSSAVETSAAPDRPATQIAAIENDVEASPEISSDRASLQSKAENTAMQHDPAESSDREPRGPRHAHGGALPR